MFNTLRSHLRSSRLASTLLAALLAGGCGSAPGTGSDRGGAGTEHAVSIAGRDPAGVAIADSSAERAARDLRREAPPERQLSSRILDDLRPGAESWVLAWRVGLGLFRLEQLEGGPERPIPTDSVATFDASLADQELRLRHLYLPSPDASLLVDAHLDWSLEDRDGLVRARRDRPGGVVIVHLREQAQLRLLDPVPGGRIDGAVWIDPSTLAILASEPRAHRPFAAGPVLYLFDLERERMTRYAGPTTDREKFDEVGRRLEGAFRHQSPELAFD